MSLPACTVETIPAGARRVLIGANPKAGSRARGGLVAELVERLREANLVAELHSDLDELCERANQLHSAGELRALVAVGGDGTAAELVNRTDPGVPLAVLPVGTENLLAKYLGLEASPGGLCRILQAQQVLRLDAGRAGNRVFLLMLSCGFDAEVVRQLSAMRTGHISHWTYAKPILSAVRSYRYPALRLTTDPPLAAGDDRAHAARWAFLFNLPCYAGGLRLAPLADGGDGLLDLCTFARGSLWHGLWYLGGVILGWHHRLPDFKQQQVRRVRIESEGEVPYQLDGDPGGRLPVDVEVLPRRLTLFAAADRFPAARQPATLAGVD